MKNLRSTNGYMYLDNIILSPNKPPMARISIEVNDRLYVYDAQGAGHNEWYWQQRVKIPLKFLLSRSTIEPAGTPTYMPIWPPP